MRLFGNIAGYFLAVCTATLGRAQLRVRCRRVDRRRLHSTAGLLSFEGSRELRIEAYDVSRTNAQVHTYGRNAISAGWRRRTHFWDCGRLVTRPLSVDLLLQDRRRLEH